jgi:hypothetical protein
VRADVANELFECLNQEKDERQVIDLRRLLQGSPKQTLERASVVGASV